jgi:hypothetical protein
MRERIKVVVLDIKLIGLVVVITLISGFGDAQGFVHASNIWNNGVVVWSELAKSVLGFGLGISTYWLVLKYMKELGILSTEIQTVFWFAITLISVAVISGNFGKWQLLDRMVAVSVVLGIGWLLFRTSV